MRAIQVEGLWSYIQTLTLSNRNKQWLAERLIESHQIDAIEMKQEKEVSLVRESMRRAMDELHQAQQAGTSMPNIDNLIAELQ